MARDISQKSVFDVVHRACVVKPFYRFTREQDRCRRLRNTFRVFVYFLGYRFFFLQESMAQGRASPKASRGKQAHTRSCQRATGKGGFLLPPQFRPCPSPLGKLSLLFLPFLTVCLRRRCNQSSFSSLLLPSFALFTCVSWCSLNLPQGNAAPNSPVPLSFAGNSASASLNVCTAKMRALRKKNKEKGRGKGKMTTCLTTSSH